MSIFLSGKLANKHAGTTIHIVSALVSKINQIQRYKYIQLSYHEFGRSNINNNETLCIGFCNTR